MADRETSKYSIAFAKAKNNCLGWVEFEEADRTCSLPNGEVKNIEQGSVKIVYTNQCYTKETDCPKTPPYPKISTNYSPTDPTTECLDTANPADYLTGQEYIELDDKPNGNTAGKHITDLPLCEDTSVRVDVIPTIAVAYIDADENIIITSNNGFGTTPTRHFTSFVFGGDIPSQSVSWSIIDPGDNYITPVISDTATPNAANVGITIREKRDNLKVRATSNMSSSTYDEATILLKPEIFFIIPDDFTGYYPNREYTFDRWVFGGGGRQGTNVDISGKTDSTTKLTLTNPSNVKIKTGSNEKGILTICVKPGDISGLTNKCETIYPYYLVISPSVSPTGEHCGGTQQFTATLKLDGPMASTEDVTNLVTWSITAPTISNPNPNTRISTSGLLTFGNRVILGTGNVISLYIINPGSGYHQGTTNVIFNRPTGSTGANATAQVIIDTLTGQITGINITSSGSGYLPDDTVSIVDNDIIPGTGCEIGMSVNSIILYECENRTITIVAEYQGLKVTTV
jgi:hypothetical protein